MRGVANAQKDIPGDLVPRAICGDLPAQPFLECPHPFDTANIVIALFAVLQKVAELQRPVVDIFRRLKQRID